MTFVRLWKTPEPQSSGEDTEWHQRCVQGDEAFKKALLAAHPNLAVGVNEQPGTDSPRTVLRPATLAAPRQGWNW